jgi:uncharacterized protein
MLRLVACSTLLFFATLLTAQPPATKEISGLWYGVLKVGAIELRLGFQVEKKDDKLTAKMHSVDQTDTLLPAKSVEFKDGTLTIKLDTPKLAYVGKLQEDGNTIRGELEQGAKMKLTLTRVSKAPSKNRPQLPKKPYPYEAEEVTFDSKAAGVKLAGTLTRPKGDGPFTTVVMISGSGPQDRDETILAHKPFLVIADHLTRNGIAVLRFDDRGVGKSTGKFDTATSKDFADDVRGAVKFLKARKDVSSVGLIGHSEGGLIAPIVAIDTPDVAFIVLLAGPGVPGDEIIVLQSELIALAMGETKEAVAKQTKLQKALIDKAKSGANAKEMEESALQLRKELPKDDQKEFDDNKEMILAQVKTFSSPWFRYFLSYDPRESLRKVKCPVLALNGEFDLQVPPGQNLKEIEKALTVAGNKAITIKELKGLNHLFQPTKTGLPSEYGVIEETIAPVALEAITEWIRSHFGR